MHILCLDQDKKSIQAYCQEINLKLAIKINGLQREL